MPAAVASMTRALMLLGFFGNVIGRDMAVGHVTVEHVTVGHAILGHVAMEHVKQNM